MVYKIMGAPATGQGGRHDVQGPAGPETVALRSNGRTMDDSGTVASSGPHPTWGTPTRSRQARSGEYALVSESKRVSMGDAPTPLTAQEDGVRLLCAVARRWHVGHAADGSAQTDPPASGPGAHAQCRGHR
jgi:hypothetical protein